jgi:Stress responsive A/B Barrel Domain
MIKHVVLFRLKDSAEGESKAGNAKRMKAEIEALKAKVPGVVRIEAGINLIDYAGAYNVAIYSEFASKQDLDDYMQHPEHRRVVEFINKVCEARAVVDYEA